MNKIIEITNSVVESHKGMTDSFDEYIERQKGVNAKIEYGKKLLIKLEEKIEKQNKENEEKLNKVELKEIESKEVVEDNKSEIIEELKETTPKKVEIKENENESNTNEELNKDILTEYGLHEDNDMMVKYENEDISLIGLVKQIVNNTCVEYEKLREEASDKISNSIRKNKDQLMEYYKIRGYDAFEKVVLNSVNDLAANYNLKLEGYKLVIKEMI